MVVSDHVHRFSYDGFGNVTKAVISGHSGLSFQPTYAASNRISSVPGATITYDGMGNMTQDNLGNMYSYDAEGRQVKVNGNATTFDAFSRPAQIQSGSAYTQTLYSASGQKFAYMNGTTLIKYIDPMVAGMAAVHVYGAAGYFQHADWLGTSRLGVTGAGTAQYDRAYAPFGEPYVETASTNRDFTGQTEDTTPGLYDFLFRQQSQSQGRWLAPDPAGLAAVDITNPQTWNRYAYVGNQPLSYIDPLGLKLRICGDQNHCPVSYTDAGAIGFWGGDNFWVSGDPREEPVGITVGLGVIFAGTGTYNDIRHIGGGSPEQYLCNKALATAKANSVAVTNAVNNWSVLANATQATGNVSITPYLLAAIGIRETGFRSVAQTGGGPGYGVFQITTGPSTG